MELQIAYEQLAESYERLARQAQLCRRLVVSAALQRGAFPCCYCDVRKDPAETVALPGADSLMQISATPVAPD